MPIDPTKMNAAASAYSHAAGLKDKFASPHLPGEGPEANRPSFADLLGESLDDARDIGYRGEAKSAQAIAGKAELHDLVVAVSNAELSLDLIVAVRDRAISAYNDIIKMPI